MIKRFVNILLPKMSWRRKLARKVLVKLHLKSSVVAGFYNTWSQQQKTHPALREELRDISNGPLISIIVPTYNTPQRYLDGLVYSIISQAYENWELILSDASTNPERKASIKQYVHHDTRIKVFPNKTKGISNNTNYGIEQAKGEYIAFCDHDDLLEPFALYEVVLKIVDEQAELIYTDEDKISDNGDVYFDPHYKPDWSPDLLTHVNYITHLTVIKKQLLDKAGLLNPNKDGAQDYDLLLRVMDLDPKIVHVSKVLYHWRAAQNSTAQDFSSKKNITDAAKGSLEEHFRRQGIVVKATPKLDRPGFYKLKFNSPKAVSIIVTPFASDAVLRLFIEILCQKTNDDTAEFEIIIPKSVQLNGDYGNLKIVQVDGIKTYIQDAVAIASAETIILCSRIAIPANKDWAVRLTSTLEQKHIRAVSPVLVHNESIIVDCGLVRNSYGNYLPLFKDTALYNNQTYFGNTDWVRNVDALTGGIMAVRKIQLEQFLSSYEGNNTKALLEFSKTSLRAQQFNTIYTEVVLDTYAITLSLDNPDTKFFNSNLMTLNADYIPYTPESAALNILLCIAEDLGIKV